MKYVGIYWTLFAPMMKKGITRRFGREQMPAFCATDEVMFRLQHGRLHREHTIANGDGVCDL